MTIQVKKVEFGHQTFHTKNHCQFWAVSGSLSEISKKSCSGPNAQFCPNYGPKLCKSISRLALKIFVKLYSMTGHSNWRKIAEVNFPKGSRDSDLKLFCSISEKHFLHRKHSHIMELQRLRGESLKCL